MSGTLQPRPDGGGTEVSYALPEGSAASADQPLVCQFSCCPATIVPATVDAATGRVSCTAPCAKINNVTVTVKTAEGDVLISDYINDTGAESPPSPPKAEPGSGRLAGESRKAYMKREYSTLKPFVIISSSYLLFTITDGALRMIVLLHAYGLGFSAFETAILFTLYEVAGVVTNLLAGVMGAKWGIRATLLTGLSLQVLGIGMLFGWQNEWALEENRWKGMLYVIIAQMWAGIAKDLTKLGGKTVTKLVTPDEKQSKLFQLVSFITGFKNSLKGFGYFLGSALVAVNYYLALGVMMGLVVLAMPWAAIGLSKELGQTRKENISMAAIFKQSPQINWLSAARFFLFGSRDLWFEVALPYFLRDTFFGPGLSRTVVGTYLAVFIIIYGQVQSWSPQLLLGPLRQGPPYTTNKFVGALWAAILLVCPVYLAILMLGTDVFYPPSSDSVKLGTMTAGIAAFCLIFAVNSSVHSYLVVRYSDGNTVSMNVGFYYMANAMGRLTGTIVSGALYSYAGGVYEYYLEPGDEPCIGTVTSTPGGELCTTADSVRGFGYCFVASCVFVVMASVLMFPIKDNEGGMRCGALACCGASARADEEAGAAKKYEKDSKDEDAEAAAISKGVETVPPGDVEMRSA
mmetsp:Transcript_5324/g.13481  ORF Transcript_5324/g.13481 Transcript_5324/m.13481 type:complete len:631 (+) Transcript_5324:176-2068(+)|eukprot:jgi/Tetstr1/456248/TSEL_043009.t1